MGVNSKFLQKYLVYLFFAFTGCVKPYDIEVAASDNRYLTVDGFINSKGITTITLSRTLNLSETGEPTPESNARVFVEAKEGNKFLLNEITQGSYSSDALTLDLSREYRLFIKTAAGREYASDYTTVLNTPPIDSISWKVESNGVQIYVNTHDPENSIRYYRWDYEDTWEFTSAYNTNLTYVTDTVIIRQDDIYHCWASDQTNKIDISNSLKLERDIISNYPLHFIFSNSVKLRYKYSILVKQYAQSEDEYRYWEALKKNTENIGSMYDPLPSRLTGNIHSLTDPSETVIGFIGAFGFTEKRIFILKESLPEEWEYETGYEDCDLPLKTFLRDIPTYLENGRYIPLYPFYSPPPGGGVVGYYLATKECTDCRERGSNVKPDFW